jgi:hypothetical protein
MCISFLEKCGQLIAKIVVQNVESVDMNMESSEKHLQRM